MKKNSNNTILALGADVKSRFCIRKNGKLFFSDEFGDLSVIKNFSRFKKAIDSSRIKPQVLAFDMHPNYFSSRHSDSIPTRKRLPVQHHHAHVASIMASEEITSQVIGVAFDGTGYGADGNLWGGEFLVVDKAGYKRMAHFQYMAMPGAEFAVNQPWRMAFSVLYDSFGETLFKKDLKLLKLHPKKDYDLLVKMIRRGINSPLTSSVGRLFDAVSSILDICHIVKFEAQAAIELEKVASKSDDSGLYEFELDDKKQPFIISYRGLIKEIYSDIKNGIPKEAIAKRFHNSLANVIIKVLNRIRSEYNIRDVVLSGGVFANKLLLESAKKRISDSGCNLITSEDVPVNDLSICLGQAYIASHSKQFKLKGKILCV
ncbi:hypothetical protein ACFL96_20080 [Thermoproteota archaeon]